MSFSRTRNPNPQLYQIRADVLLQTIARPVWLMSCSSESGKNTGSNVSSSVSVSSTPVTVTSSSPSPSTVSTSNVPATSTTTTGTETSNSSISTLPSTVPLEAVSTTVPNVPNSSIPITSLPVPSLASSSSSLFSRPTFDHIPDTYLVSLRNDGFDYLYILGVWQTGEIGLKHSQSLYPSLPLPHLVSSPFAVSDYHVDDVYGGDTALRNLKQRANNIGLRILIDFIPNHIARDHWWIKTFPWLLQQYHPADSNGSSSNHSDYTFPIKVSSKLQQSSNSISTATKGNAVSVPVPSSSSSSSSSSTSSSSSPATVPSTNETTTTTTNTSNNSLIPTENDDFVTLNLYYGRDMYNIWKDTVNLNHRHPDTRTALLNTLRWILTGKYPNNHSGLSLASITMNTTTASVRSNSNGEHNNGDTGGGLADGVRVDMAMLLLNDVINKTWGTIDPNTVLPGPIDRNVYALQTAPTLPSSTTTEPTVSSSSSASASASLVRPIVNEEFWSWALADIKSIHPSCLILGEVYWDYESKLQAYGFDFTYDKSLLDKLYGSNGDSIMQHLRSSILYQRKSAHFIENHDEKRIAAVHRGGSKGTQAAAVIAYTIQGMHFFHDGQITGRKLHHSVHLRYRTPESTDIETIVFYKRLLTILKFPEFRNYGCWHQAIVTPSRDGNDTWRNIVAYFITPLPGSTILQTTESVRNSAEKQSNKGRRKSKDNNDSSSPASSSLLSTVHSQSLSSTTSSSGSTVVDSPVTSNPTPSATGRSPIDDTNPTVTAVMLGGENTTNSSKGGSGTVSLPSTTNSTQSFHSTNSITTESTTVSQKIAPEFLPLPMKTASNGNGNGSNSGGDGAGTNIPLPSDSPNPSNCMGTSLDPEDIIAGRTFLVVINYSDRYSNGHILFTRADESTYQQNMPELMNSAMYISSLVNGQLAVQSPTGCYLGISKTTTTSTSSGNGPGGGSGSSVWNPSSIPVPSNPNGSGNGGLRRLGFMDHLSSYTKEYPCAVLANEGWWVNLEPWKAHILELVQLGEE